MASTVPAMRGKLGSTQYYIVTMKAKDVAEKMKAAVEVEGWDDLSLEQKYQREIDIKRIRRDIAPYLARDEDRFFGCLIVAIQNGQNMEYEPVKEVARGRPFTGSHNLAANGLGFLSLTGEEILIPIDGQHRAKAIDFAIRGRDDHNKELDFRANPNLAQDDVTLMLIAFDTESDRSKARKIFNKVNRYAKNPSKAENLIIDDDDIAAVFARRMTEPEEDLFSGDLVRRSGNALSDSAGEFTTLSTIYEINREILIQRGHAFNRTERPNKETEKLYWTEVEKVWHTLVTEIKHFSHALKDPKKSGNDIRKQVRKTYLLGKPIGQRVLASAFLELTEKGKLSCKDACKRLNNVDWQIKNDIWENVLTRDKTRVLSGITVMKLGRDFVTYLTGRPMTEKELKELKDRVSPEDQTYQLPSRVCPVINGWK